MALVIIQASRKGLTSSTPRRSSIIKICGVPRRASFRVPRLIVET